MEIEEPNAESTVSRQRRDLAVTSAWSLVAGAWTGGMIRAITRGAPTALFIALGIAWFIVGNAAWVLTSAKHRWWRYSGAWFMLGVILVAAPWVWAMRNDVPTSMKVIMMIAIPAALVRVLRVLTGHMPHAR